MSFKDKLILFFIFFKFISSELEEEDMIRAFSCLNIVTKNVRKDEDSQSKFYSPYMLSCFIKITNEQMKTIFSGIEEDKEDFNSLEEEEIEQLLDLDSLQDIPEKDLKKYSVKLEKTMKKFEKMDKEIERMQKKNQKNQSDDDIDDKELSSFDDDEDDDTNYNDDDFDYDDDDYDDDDEDYSSPKRSRRQKGLFKIFFRGIKKFFNNSNIWFVFLFIIVLYFLLLAMRKSFEAEKEEKIKKEDEKGDNKEKNEKDKEDGSKENKEKENKGKENEDKNIKKEKDKEKEKKD